MPNPHIELIIFDCDGVLIDSEMLSASVLMGMMDEVGLPITPEIFRTDFLGRSFASATKQVEKRFGRSFPPEFQSNYRERLLRRMRGNLKAMPGVEDVLKAITIPFCLATSSSPPRLQVSMEESRLGHYFRGKSYTASLVANGKPAPDLPLYAAAQMGFAPEKCLVIEDSEMGLRSSLAAGMETWHFIGGAHCRNMDPLPDDVKPHRVLDSMPALHNAFREIGIST